MTDHTGVSIGIDVAEERKGLDLVAIDDERLVVGIHSHLTIEQAAWLVDETRPSVVCIDSPAQWSTSGNSREADRVLARLGINAFRVPAEGRAGPFHAWMRVGFALYRALEPRYPRYRGGAVLHTAAEYFPHASAVVLAGRVNPLKDKTSFRRQVLEDNRVDTSALVSLDQLDAALGALTGCIALHDGHSWVGDADEGALLLPASLPTARIPRCEHLSHRP
jgi:predicted nuclease with RNAse H fold